MSAFARRLTHPDEELARDLVQEAIVKGYRHFLAGNLDLDRGLKAWLVRVVSNDFYANRWRSKRFEAGPLDHEPICDRLGPEESAIRNDEFRQVLEAIATLSPEQRLVIEMIDLAGLEYSEVARALGIPLGTVRSRLIRARLRVAGRLTRGGGFGRD